MRRVLAVLTSIGLGIGAIALATPVQAETTVTVTVTDGSNPGTFALSPSSLTATNITIDNQTTLDFGIRVISTRLLRNGQFPCQAGCDVSAGQSETFEISSQTPSNTQVEIRDVRTLTRVVTLVVTYTSGGGGGGGGGDDSGSSAPASAAPAVVDVTLDQITSEVLRTWASTATLGSWKQLPESSEIIGVDENAGRTFLGAATTPDFPVDIAQRQVDNGWGAYQTFNEDGDLTAVFIPAGGWMHITNSTRLYAIWSE